MKVYEKVENLIINRIINNSEREREKGTSSPIILLLIRSVWVCMFLAGFH